LNYLSGATSAVQTQINTLNGRTISAGDGLTGGGDLSANRTISHADTSSQASVDNSGTTFIQDITLDTFGHVTGIGSKTISVNITGAGNIQINPGTGITGGGTFNVNQSTNQNINVTGVTHDSSVWNTGTSTTEAVISPAKLASAVATLSGTAGFGNVWRDRTSLRSVNTNYQNTTGGYLAVSVVVNSTDSTWKTNTSGAEAVELKVGSTTSTQASRAEVPSVLGFQTQTLFTIVPPNYFYSVVPLGTGRIFSWHELD
jgi:hypothetical protein